MKRKDLFTILFLFFSWRISLFIPLLIGEKILAFHKGYEYTYLWNFIKPYFPVDNIFLYPWASFDGIHYLRIASEGYSNNLGFMPFFPFTINLVAKLFGGYGTFTGSYFFAGFFLANIFFLASLFMLFKLLILDFSKKQAYLVIIFLLLFPTSFFFGAIYSESLFLLLCVSIFYFARKKQWVIASLIGFLLPITRIVGIFIFPALIVEFLQQEQIKNWKKFKKSRKINLFLRFLPIIFIPFSLIGFSIYNFWQKGSFFYFLSAHGTLGNGRTVDSLILMPQTIYRYIKILFSVPIFQLEWGIALLELSIFFIVFFLLFLAIKNKIRLSYIVFSVLCFLLSTFSGTFSGLPRYSIVLFPIFIVLILISSKAARISYVIASTTLLFILLILFSKGYFVA